MQSRRRAASLRPLRPRWPRGPQQLFTLSGADYPPLPLPRGSGWCGKEMPCGERSSIRETSWWAAFHKFPVSSSSLRKWGSLIITCWKLSVRSSSKTRWLYRGLKAESDQLPKIINAERSKPHRSLSLTAHTSSPPPVSAPRSVSVRRSAVIHGAHRRDLSPFIPNTASKVACSMFSTWWKVFDYLYCGSVILSAEKYLIFRRVTCSSGCFIF